MARKWVNNGFTTFGSALNSSDTSLTVKTGEGARFPIADSASGGDDYFYLTLVAQAGDLEIVKVTAHSVGSDTMTIVRAQEATTAGSFAIGDVIELRITASGLNAFATLDDTQTLTNKTLTSPTMSAPTITGVSVAPTASSGANSTQLATTAFVQQELGALVTIPSGLISLWSGAVGAIPSGWALCDGTNGTPNLVDRFVVGAGSTYSVDDTGGSADATLVSHSHTTDSAGSHSHSGSTNSAGSHTHGSAAGSGFISNGGAETLAGGYDLPFARPSTTASAGSHSHSVSVSSAGSHSHTTTTEGSSATNANLPPYYALAYIMKL